MIPMIREEVVLINGWVTDMELIDMVAISQMTPGPIAINLGTYIGYKTLGVLGSSLTTFAVCLPSFIIMSLAFKFVSSYRDSVYLDWFFTGLRPVVVGLILSGALSIVNESLVDLPTVLIALVSFGLVHMVKLNPMLVIGLSAVAGVAIYGF